MPDSHANQNMLTKGWDANVAERGAFLERLGNISEHKLSVLENVILTPREYREAYAKAFEDGASRVTAIVCYDSFGGPAICSLDNNDQNSARAIKTQLRMWAKYNDRTGLTNDIRKILDSNQRIIVEYDNQVES